MTSTPPALAALAAAVVDRQRQEASPPAEEVAEAEVARPVPDQVVGGAAAAQAVVQAVVQAVAEEVLLPELPPMGTLRWVFQAAPSVVFSVLIVRTETKVYPRWKSRSGLL